MGTSWRRVDPFDAVLALALTLVTQAEIWAPQAFGAEAPLADRPLLSVTSLLITLPLMLRRTHPWLVAVIAFGAEVTQARLTTPPDGLGNLLAMLVVAYSLGRWAPRPAGYAGGALVGATAFSVGEDLADNVFVLIVLGAAWAAGVLVGRRTDDLADLEVRRLTAAREGAEEERLRIARELHDVVAHRVTLIVVQSQLADTLLDDDPDAARAAVRAVEQAGRDALTELRSVLGLLHGDASATRSPGETDLDALSGLVDQARAGGLPVHLSVEGDPRPVPPAVALAAFRIVQESLTNVVRHAARASTQVQLRYLPGSVEVAVEDAGPGLDGDPAPGHGLAGMAERAAFVGGRLTAGRRAPTGFTVRAVLPTPEPER